MTKLEALDGYDPVAAGEQDERGTDLVGLRESLRMSTEERLRVGIASANSAFRFADAVRTARSRKAA